MSDQTDRIGIKGSAPIIYFESAPTLNFVPGVLHIGLACIVSEPTGPKQAETMAIPVANLRCNPVAARGLIRALEQVLDAHDKKTALLAQEKKDGFLAN